ncbi:MAG: hypothetical protein LBL94_04455 [Prevotellaceae bacterium]|jgi:hypothetical protein|nr:hypothetical protein [Prevotellaceae bacterium]
MKNYAKALLTFFAALCICLPSCMDNVDIDNLSTDMKLGGKLAFPVGASKFTIKDLLERYEADTLFRVGVDTAGTVMLYVENIVDYETPDLFEEFGTLVDSMMNFSVKTKPFELKGFNFTAKPSAGSVMEKDTTMTFDFNNLNDDGEVQEITRILFKETTIKVKVNTFDANYKKDFMVITMQIPGTTDSIVIDASQASSSEKKINLEIRMDKEDKINYKVKFKVTGDGESEISTEAKIDISIAFEDSEYAVFGYFYYNDGKKQMQPYHVNLFSYLPEGTDFRFFAPSFKFDVTSNIGIPFIFDLDTLTSYSHDESEPTHVKINMGGSNIINRAPTLGSSATSAIVIDKDKFPGGNASAIFKTSLDSISAAYAFKVPERDNSTDQEEQFIESGSWMRMTASAQMPFWLDGGSVIAYADTITGIDLSAANDYITSAALIFTYTSNLPLGFEVTITPLDENMRPIEVSSPDKYRYNIKAAPVDGDGAVSSPLKGTFNIDYDKSVAGEMKKAKHLKINVKAKGVTPDAKIKIADTNGLEIKVELRAEGGVDYNP